MPVSHRRCLSILALVLLSLPLWSARPLQAQSAPPAAAAAAPSLSSLPPFQPCQRDLAGATTATTNDTVVATCQLTLSAPGTLVMLADGTIMQGKETRLRLFVDGVSVLTHYVDMPDTLEGFGLRRAVAVAAGPHSVTFTLARQQGTGAVSLLEGDLNVITIGSTRTDMKVCGGVRAESTTTTSEAGYIVLASCSLQAPTAGSVLILASANQYLVNSAVQANYRVGEPGVSVNAHSDRLVDVTTNSNDGTDVAVTTMGRMEIAAGQTLEVGLVVKRVGGTGTVGVRHASVIGLFLPANGPIDWCATLTDAVVGANQSVAACTLQIRSPGALLLISDMSVDAQATNWTELYSKIYLTGTGPIVNRHLWKDSADDLSAPATRMTPVLPGTTTASAYVNTAGPSLDIYLTDPGIIALVFPDSRLYLPVIVR
jgi:hypothetical protein